jgi:predicted signal transduction protein with EAL and GGDEF domain
VEELLHEADMALYEAKAAGRDCLRIAKPSAGVETSTPALPQRMGRGELQNP